MISLIENIRPVIIAHRGLSSIAPENTLSAIKAAIDKQYKMIEIDIRLSKDNELVIIHDYKIDRSSNGSGKVSALNLAELKSYDFGKWFSGDFTDERIPTLNEVFETCKNKVLIDLEIKIPPFFNRSNILISKLMGTINEFGMGNSVFISSFNNRILIELKKRGVKIPLVPLYDNFLTRLTSIKMIKEKNMAGAIYNYKIISGKLINKIHNLNKFIAVYTVNKKEEIGRLISLGVDGIITNGIIE